LAVLLYACAITFALHLWVLALAGIAAFQKAERPWFVDRLRVLARRNGLSDWSWVLSVLKSFLGIDVALAQAR
jgi:hypothetical protein